MSSERRKQYMREHNQQPGVKEKKRAYNRKHYAQNKERCLAKSRAWYKNNPLAALKSTRKATLKRNFALLESDYEWMVKAQHGICAICHEPEVIKRNSRLSVDHDHKTGIVRGLLCFSCNVMLGRAKDDCRILESAITYLSRTLPKPETTDV